MSPPFAGIRRRGILVALLVLATGCGTVARAEGDPSMGAGHATSYRTVMVGGAGSVTALRANLGADAFREVLRLNRVDAFRVAALDSLVLPEPAAGFRAPSPFPPRIEVLAGVPKLVVVSNRVQAFAAYAAGELVRWGPVSTGTRATPTPSGSYHVNWKLPDHRSTVDPTWRMRWCVNVDNRVGMALHEYALPGRPASHCCVRLGAADARWIYDWVDPWRLDGSGRNVLARGTPVRILGEYDFDAPRPWRRLPVDPAADRLTPEEVATIAPAELARTGEGRVP